MNAEQAQEIFNWIVIHVVPFAAFFVGVQISIILKLNRQLRTNQVWWSSIPVAFFTIGTLLGVSRYAVPIPGSNLLVVGYGHYDDVPRFLTFTGTLMFYGTVVARLFDQIRGSLQPNTGPIAAPTIPTTADASQLSGSDSRVCWPVRLIRRVFRRPDGQDR